MVLSERLFNLFVASVMLAVAAPLFAIAALSIRLSSPGPILFRAERTGRGGHPFIIHKFRTMSVDPAGSGPPITGMQDKRVFRVGSFLRRSKIDELPQLFDVLRGDMAIVGPRPEDPGIVARYYDERQKRTLEVLPGLTSPGALFEYTHGIHYLAGENLERDYIEKLLPVMLDIELVYVENRSLRYDMWVILRTASTILRVLAGQRDFPDAPELRQIRAQRELSSNGVDSGASGSVVDARLADGRGQLAEERRAVLRRQRCTHHGAQSRGRQLQQ